MKFQQLLLIALLVIGFLACKQKTASEAIESVESTTYKYKLTPFDSSKDFEDATLSNMQYVNGDFSYDVGGKTYVLGSQTADAENKMCANSDKGQHIHLIIDDNPYSAQYTDKFHYLVKDGEHHILSFLSRSYHESIKTASAFLAQKVTVKDSTIINTTNIEDTMLFYSRPKGTYVGKDTEKVMLDFYLVNGNLDSNHYVQADINGEIHKIDKWQPYYIEGLPMGENKITLSLMTADGNLLDTPLNPVTRVFTLIAEPEIK